jgi:uncharacterized protein YciI
MPYFALFYEVVDDFVTLRTPFRQKHLQLVEEAHARSELVLAGALSEPADRALLVFQCADRAVPETFARLDPYVVNGLVRKWEVRLWNAVIGNK